MKKADFIKAIAKQAGTSQKEADAVLAATLATIRDALKKGDSVAFLKFGTFKITKRAARKGRIPYEHHDFLSGTTQLPRLGQAERNGQCSIKRLPDGGRFYYARIMANDAYHQRPS